MIGIYDDEETREVLKKIKEYEPQFNISAFFKQKLLEYSGVGDDKPMISEEEINKKIRDTQLKKDGVDSEIQYWIDVKKKLWMYQEKEKERKVAEESEAERNNRIKDEARRGANDIFHEITLRDMTDDEWEQYNNLDKTNIWAYAEKFK